MAAQTIYTVLTVFCSKAGFASSDLSSASTDRPNINLTAEATVVLRNTGLLIFILLQKLTIEPARTESQRVFCV